MAVILAVEMAVIPAVEMVAIQAVEMVVVQETEGMEGVQEAEEMAKAVAVAMCDLDCQCSVGLENITTRTLSRICVVCGSPL